MPFVTSSDGTQIGYTAIGAGPALVIVDGALCWRGSGPSGPLAAELKDRFTVYTYDRRGRGESGNTLPFSPDREVEDLAAVIEAAGGHAAVYAISSGVLLALAAAERLGPQKITAMVLYEAPIYTDASHRLDPAYVPRLSDLIARGDNAGAVRLFMRNVGVPGFGLLMMQLMGITRKLAPVAPTLAYDTAFCSPYWTSNPPPDGSWTNATMPILNIGGGKSDAWMQNTQAAISRVLPNATHSSLPGQNHMVAATAIAPLIKEFIR
jgi:pimeloyl-ACP methyl ester carboxylesterase